MIVAWHGFMGSGEDFSPLRKCVEVSLQTPDLVGHGGHSSLNPKDFELEQQLLYWSTRIPQGTILLGYSMGGRLALQFALRYPEKLSGLILIGATPGIREESERLQRVVWDREQAKRLSQQRMQLFYSYWQRLPIIQSQSSIPDTIRKSMVERRIRQDPHQLALSMTHFGTGTMPHCWEELNTLSVPTLLVVGEFDNKYRLIADEMLNSIPSELVTVANIKNAGHCAHLENISESANCISGWLHRESEL